jgi:protein-tyrosine-phosphatase
MAEALARNWLKINALQNTETQITSAGLAAFSGSPASQQAIVVMAERGLDLTCHKAKQFSGELLVQSDIVFTVTENHRRALVKMFPQAAAKIHVLAEFAGRTGFDIADPFGQSVDVYRKCAAQMEELIDRAFSKLFNQGKNL